MLAMPQQPMMRPFHQTGAPMQDYQQQQQQHAVAVPAAAAASAAAVASAAHNTGTSPPHTNHPSSLQNPNSSSGNTTSSTVTAAQPSSMHPNEPPVYYHLDIVQQPIQARAMGWGPKADSRRPVDPPPVINFQVRNAYNENVTQDINNNFIVHASLCEVEGEEKHHHHHHHHHHNQNQNATGRDSAVPNRLTGTTLVSLTHIRSPAPGKFFFLLHDLSIRQEGRYQLVFNVYEVMGDQGCIRHRAQVMSNPITVYSPKTFPGLETSSELIKEIASQGCRVRVRKESTFKRKKPKRSAAPTLPPSIANNLVQTLQQQQQQQQQQQANLNPGGLYQQQYPVYNQPLDYSDHYQTNALPPPIQHAQQPHSEYTHMYSFEEYRSTPMSATSSVASQPAPAPAPIPPAAPSNGYFRGYEALLSAAAHQQQHQHQQHPAAAAAPHHGGGHHEYHQPMPPTPVYDRDRLGSVSTHHHSQQLPMNIRNSRSQSYPMVGFGNAQGHPQQQQQATNMPPPSPKSPHFDASKDHHSAVNSAPQYDGYQDPYYQQQQQQQQQPQQQPYLTRPAKLVNPQSRVPTPPATATAKDGSLPAIDDQSGSAQDGAATTGPNDTNRAQF